MNSLGYVQKGHVVQITTALTSDALLVQALDGEESLSEPGVFRVRLLSENASLPLDDAAGQTACLTIASMTGTTTYIHGIISSLRQGPTGNRFTAYDAELRPKLWLLKHTRDSRIFQNQSTPDIVKAVLLDQGVTDVKDQLTGTYAARTYCVQYQESAFDFVSRLLEEDGIAYRLEHTDSADTVVLLDDRSGYGAGPSLKMSISDSPRDEIDALLTCSIEVRVTSGKYALDDYNFELPSTNLLGTASGKTATLSVYEYPARSDSKDGVEAIADRRLQEVEVPRRVVRGTSCHPGVRAGCTFKIADHSSSGVDGEYVVWRVRHRADQNTYSNEFEAVPADVTFRPPRVTPSPRIVGCQTAVVVGKSGEEITTDKYGRIKLKFHWDQSDVRDEQSSCWVRVAQGWAGKQWGTFFLPRVGQEVVVSFIDGDPDRPLVTGCVYNAQQTLPYTLPDNQTRSVIKTDSSKGGGGFNEIRFEDKKDEEELFLQAQKDMNVVVLNNQSVKVKTNRTVTVEEADESLTVQKGKRSVTVAGDETHDNQAKLTYTIKDDLALTVGGKVTLTVTGDLVLKVSGAVTIQSTGNLSLTSDGAVSQKSMGAFATESAQNMTVKAGVNLTQEAGVQLTSKSGATQQVEAGAILVLKGALVKIN